MHKYLHHIGDYDRDTAALTLAQHGAYGKLMRSYYATERPLPADTESLWRICGAMDKAERLAVSFVAERFFQLDGNVLRHKRIEREIVEYHEFMERQHENGKKGGRPPGSKTQKKPTGNPSLNPPANPNGTQTEPNQKPVTSNQCNTPLSPRPTLESARSIAGDIGITTQEAEDWWHAREASEWMKGTGGGGTTPVGANWQSDAKTYTNRERERKAKEAAKPNGYRHPAPQRDPSKPLKF